MTQMLQNIDPSITGWIMGVQNTVRVQLNDKKRMIINLMGDGTRKAFALCTKLYNVKNGLNKYDEDESSVWRHDRASLHHAFECEIELR